MSLDRESRCEGRGCVRARRQRSTVTHGETKKGFGLGMIQGQNVGNLAYLGCSQLEKAHGNMEGRSGLVLVSKKRYLSSAKGGRSSRDVRVLSWREVRLLPLGVLGEEIQLGMLRLGGSALGLAG